MEQQPRTRQYIEIDLSSLLIDTILDFDLYLRSKSGNYVLYRNRNLKFTEKNLTHLLDNNVSSLFISDASIDSYYNYVEDNLHKIIDDAQIPIMKKSEFVYNASKSLVEQLLKKPYSTPIIKRSQRLVENTVSFILREAEAIKVLLSISSYDYYTYTHSVNVCTLGIGFAKAFGIRDPKELHIFGTGALLHDIGKSKIDESILRKRSSLSADEWELMRKHPEFGFEIVNDMNFIDPLSKIIIIQHHERLDGSGYPAKLEGEDIHLYAKLVAVVDAFDALTTKRPYKQALRSFPALKIMKTETGPHYDYELFRVFVNLLKA